MNLKRILSVLCTVVMMAGSANIVYGYDFPVSDSSYRVYTSYGKIENGFCRSTGSCQAVAEKDYFDHLVYLVQPAPYIEPDAACYGSYKCKDTLTVGMNESSGSTIQNDLQNQVNLQIQYIKRNGGTMTGYTIKTRDNSAIDRYNLVLAISWTVDGMNHYACFAGGVNPNCIGYYDIAYEDSTGRNYDWGYMDRSLALMFNAQ